ncbi:MAG: zinc-finger domain-containing protein [Gammaproteobacteria bacterium]|nr:zinc-finger domain-containing protein [Gammaproteobacteria bacterium]
MPDSHRISIVKTTDLPLHCPIGTSSKWSMHPKVYIPIEQSPQGEALCPYCGTLYRLNRDT